MILVPAFGGQKNFSDSLHSTTQARLKTAKIILNSSLAIAATQNKIFDFMDNFSKDKQLRYSASTTKVRPFW